MNVWGHQTLLYQTLIFTVYVQWLWSYSHPQRSTTQTFPFISAWTQTWFLSNTHLYSFLDNEGHFQWNIHVKTGSLVLLTLCPAWMSSNCWLLDLCSAASAPLRLIICSLAENRLRTRSSEVQSQASCVQDWTQIKGFEWDCWWKIRFSLSENKNTWWMTYS